MAGLVIGFMSLAFATGSFACNGGGGGGGSGGGGADSGGEISYTGIEARKRKNTFGKRKATRKRANSRRSVKKKRRATKRKRRTVRTKRIGRPPAATAMPESGVGGSWRPPGYPGYNDPSVRGFYPPTTQRNPPDITKTVGKAKDMAKTGIGIIADIPGVPPAFGNIWTTINLANDSTGMAMSDNNKEFNKGVESFTKTVLKTIAGTGAVIAATAAAPATGFWSVAAAPTAGYLASEATGKLYDTFMNTDVKKKEVPDFGYGPMPGDAGGLGGL